MRNAVFVTNIPTFHKVPLFDYLSKIMKAHGFKLKVLFLASIEKRRKWEMEYNSFNFTYDILEEPKININYEWTIFLPFTLFTQLNHERPDIIITGGFSLATICVFSYCKYKKIPYLIWSGEIPETSTSKSFYRKRIRKILINNAHSIIVYGSKAEAYIRMFDIRKPVFTAYNTSDIRYFSKVAANIRKNRVDSLKSLGLSTDRQHIIFVGGLVKRKGVQYLLRSLCLLKPQNNFILSIIGDGEEKDNLQQQTKDMKLEDNVIFWGHKNKSEIVKFYAIGDIFVFPTLRDIWGLVLNEAMAAGLPVISSKYAGAAYDLIKDGFNGFVVDPYNVEEMAAKIGILIENPELRKTMRENARKTIEARFTPDKSAQKFFEAVEYVQSH